MCEENLNSQFTFNPDLQPSGWVDYKPSKFTERVRQKMVKSEKPFTYREQSAGFLRYKEDYPELIAKTYNEPAANPVIRRKPTQSNWLPHCSFSLLRLKCASGHMISKAIYCGREWCETCGQKKSVIHQRRVSRWIPKARQVQTMGYLVITIPKDVRDKFNCKLALSEFRTYIRRKLKREKFAGCERGFMRYHFAGDCKYCKGKKCDHCNHTGAARDWHPHLNVLFNSTGFVTPEELETFRKDVGAWLTAFTGKKCEGNVNYRYDSREGKIKHWVAYVTRATWRFWDKKICDIIKGYHTSSSFGKFEKVIPENTTEAIEKKCCPVCLQEDGVINKLTKMILVSKDEFVWDNQKEISPGVYYFSSDG